MRRSLVVFQFTTAIVLIIGTLVVINQMNFIQSKKLGFNKEHVLILENALSFGEFRQRHLKMKC